MAKFELFLSVDAEGNSAVSLEDAETAHEACGEYNAGPVRTVCLALGMDLPTDGTDEDQVSVVEVEVPSQPPAEETPADAPALPEAEPATAAA